MLNFQYKSIIPLFIQWRMFYSTKFTFQNFVMDFQLTKNILSLIWNEATWLRANAKRQLIKNPFSDVKTQRIWVNPSFQTFIRLGIVFSTKFIFYNCYNPIIFGNISEISPRVFNQVKFNERWRVIQFPTVSSCIIPFKRKIETRIRGAVVSSTKFIFQNSENRIGSHRKRKKMCPVALRREVPTNRWRHGAHFHESMCIYSFACSIRMFDASRQHFSENHRHFVSSRNPGRG